MKGNTVPIETPQSMFEDPSNGSKTTTYLHNKERDGTNVINMSPRVCICLGFRRTVDIRYMKNEPPTL